MHPGASVQATLEAPTWLKPHPSTRSRFFPSRRVTRKWQTLSWTKPRLLPGSTGSSNAGQSVMIHFSVPSHFLIDWFFCVQDAKNNEDYESISDVDALLLVAGDPTADDEPMRKGSCFQVSICHCKFSHQHVYTKIQAMVAWVWISLDTIPLPKGKDVHSLFSIQR